MRDLKPAGFVPALVPRYGDAVQTGPITYESWNGVDSKPMAILAEKID